MIESLEVMRDDTNATIQELNGSADDCIKVPMASLTIMPSLYSSNTTKPDRAVKRNDNDPADESRAQDGA